MCEAGTALWGYSDEFDGGYVRDFLISVRFYDLSWVGCEGIWCFRGRDFRFVCYLCCNLALREGYDRHASTRLLIDVGCENFISFVIYPPASLTVGHPLLRNHSPDNQIPDLRDTPRSQILLDTVNINLRRNLDELLDVAYLLQ